MHDNKQTKKQKSMDYIFNNCTFNFNFNIISNKLIKSMGFGYAVDNYKTNENSNPK